MTGLHNATHWTLLVAMIALLLQLGGGSWFGDAHVEAAGVEDCNSGSTEWESHDSDKVEDGVSSAASLEPIAASASRHEPAPASAMQLHPGYRGSLERPPDSAA